MSSSILIYGATGGVGACLARLLADTGSQLHLVARHEETLRPLAQSLGATWTVADVLDEASFAAVTEAAPASLDGLVYAVGNIAVKPISRVSEADLTHDYRLNAIGAALAVRAALPSLRKSTTGASVVLFSSVAASRGFPSHASIAMAKAAVEGLTRSLAAELAPAVRVNAIAPSLIRTPLAARMVADPKLREAFAAAHPLGRLGEPEDIAQLAAHLLWPRSGWMTGQVIGVDGGRAAIAGK